MDFFKFYIITSFNFWPYFQMNDLFYPKTILDHFQTNFIQSLSFWDKKPKNILQFSFLESILRILKYRGAYKNY